MHVPVDTNVCQPGEHGPAPAGHSQADGGGGGFGVGDGGGTERRRWCDSGRSIKLSVLTGNAPSGLGREDGGDLRGDDVLGYLVGRLNSITAGPEYSHYTSEEALLNWWPRSPKNMADAQCCERVRKLRSLCNTLRPLCCKLGSQISILFLEDLVAPLNLFG
eukprot:COSAG02_NODE_1093_length_14617_cov_13.078661_9_plen_162_part_00